MQNQYVCHSGVKGMKWGVRKRIQESGSQAKVSSGVRNQQSDRKKARSEYKKRLKETSSDRSFARAAGSAAGAVVGVSLTGPAAKLITRSVLKRAGNKHYSELSTAAGLGAVALTSLGMTGFMEIEFRHLLKRGGNPFDERREAVHKEQASIK